MKLLFSEQVAKQSIYQVSVAEVKELQVGAVTARMGDDSLSYSHYQYW